MGTIHFPFQFDCKQRTRWALRRLSLNAEGPTFGTLALTLKPYTWSRPQGQRVAVCRTCIPKGMARSEGTSHSNIASLQHGAMALTRRMRRTIPHVANPRSTAGTVHYTQHWHARAVLRCKMNAKSHGSPFAPWHHDLLRRTSSQPRLAQQMVTSSDQVILACTAATTSKSRRIFDFSLTRGRVRVKRARSVDN